MAESKSVWDGTIDWLSVPTSSATSITTTGTGTIAFGPVPIVEARFTGIESRLQGIEKLLQTVVQALVDKNKGDDE